jgi:hypothetical protein
LSLLQVLLIDPKDVETKDGRNFFVHCATEHENDQWVYMTKNGGTVKGTGSAMVDVYWLEPERERAFDRTWMNAQHGVKLAIDRGPRKGWVGYFRTI